MIYSAYINELEERSFQHISFDMEDWSFVYFTAKDKGEEIEIKICLESENIYQRKMGFEDWWYVDYLEGNIVLSDISVK
ncbi:hypothetical protein [Bacillus atrophaeus]|uniref:hypothetical protein n=1 Tax=Bacillus atrophaeus TaxID=1452 RepID=UPI00227E863F|nr:hypothetical protein [Bacillus atrophaeus]MCY8921153.1 hypothetical protein [Bacillus atrophaeus]MCY9166288.1 hypothetical protein [Bacillus atrophaeus]